MVAIVDYGVGNLFSLHSSFKAVGEESCVTSDPEVIEGADRLVLPGVGAFGDAAKKLRSHGLDEIVCQQVAKGKPLLGTNRFWASAWACSCCLKKAMSTASIWVLD